MGSTGQLVGGIAGAVIGAYLGQGPGGAYVGFSLGMMIGSAVDPPRGQRLAPDYSRSDAYYNAVGRNTPVPIVYGVNRVGGNLIWLSPKGTRIVGSDSKKEGGSGGGGGGSKKGGDTGQRTVIDIDWAVALSEGEITAVADVFMGDEVAELTDGMEYTAYLGTPTQIPDARIVNDLGPVAPAFRNLAYVALSAELESPSLPTVNAEVSGILGTPGGTRLSGWTSGDQYTARALVQGDGSYLAVSNNGLVQRSTDFGATWTVVCCGSAAGAGFVTTPGVADHPGVPGRVYVGVYGYPAGNIRVYRSDDYGVTWPNTSAVINDCYDIGCILGVRDHPDEVLLFGRAWIVAPWGNATCERSTDGGLTFAPTFYFPNPGWYGGMKSAIHVPGTDTIYALGGHWGIGDNPLYKSADRGVSWSLERYTGMQAVPDAGWVFNEQIFGFVGLTPSSGSSCLTTIDAGDSWQLSIIPGADAIGSARINSFGLLMASTQYSHYADDHMAHGEGPRLFYSTTFGYTWREIHLDLSQGHGGMDSFFGIWSTQALWLTTEQVCFGTGVPSYVTCADIMTPTSCGNPALIIKDFLSNTRYGLGIHPSRIDIPSFRSASAYCTAQVPSRLSSGHMEQRFCLDYVVDQQIPVVDHLRDMLATCGGYLTWSQGVVKLKIDMPSSCCQSFGMDSIVANSFQWKKRSYRDRPNVVHVDYVEPGNTALNANPQVMTTVQNFIAVEGRSTADLNINKNYKTYKHDFVEASDPWDIDTTGERRERTVNLVGIKRRSQAQRMAEYYLAKAIHCQHTCMFRVGINALKAEVGDVVAVTHDIPKWAGKLFRIVEIQEAENDELTLGCTEYNEAVFRAVAGLRPGQDEITGGTGQRLLAAPYHVARLTAYERPYENAVEINYTRIATSDLFGGVYLYKRVGEDGAWIRQDAKLSLAPTAYLTSHLHTVTLVQS